MVGKHRSGPASASEHASFGNPRSAFANPARLVRRNLDCATFHTLAGAASAPPETPACHRMRSIFSLHLKQVIRENDWILILLFLLACAVFGQYLAPTQDDPTLAYATRTQAIWSCAWL